MTKNWKNNEWFVIGIAGATCSGKTTLSRTIHEKNPGSVLFGQDNYFLPKDSDKHILIPELNHFNWDILTAFDMDRMRADISNILNTKGQGPSRLLIIEGLLVLNDEILSNLCDLKYYLTVPYDVCFERRMNRTYDPPDVPGYFEKCVWPEYLKSKEIALKLNPDILVIDGLSSPESVCETVSANIKKLVGNC